MSHRVPGGGILGQARALSNGIIASIFGCGCSWRFRANV
jgi:hypothetical protein